MDGIKETRFFSFNAVRFAFFITLFLSIDSSALAQGDLLIFPKRIVFEGRNRIEQVILSNTGKEPATYNISFLDYKMTESGEFVAITEPELGQHFATPFLRVYPRSVDLAPGESQTVKVQVINAEKMEEGECRSHLYFRAEKNNNPLGQDNEVKDSNTITVKLEAVFGISIATIVRKGKSNTSASISGLEYTYDADANHFLKFDINREGNMSTYGAITIYFISRDNKKFEVGKAGGLAVYTPGKVRKVKMQVQKPDGTYFRAGKFEVVYTADESKTIIAQARLEL
ncbi:MAG: molecular chaperone [Bacteroidota bacterium]|nr:molecular chaperone [Bacteroidota bacterium]